MPTIEVVSIEQATPLDFTDLPFAVEAENKVSSHRSLFANIVDRLTGCIYHLGNPDLKSEREKMFFFAYDLLDRARKDEFLVFNSKFVPSIRKMFLTLLEASPVRRLVFLTDWQFGPSTVTMGGQIGFETFWTMHDTRQLRLNALYTIVEK